MSQRSPLPSMLGIVGSVALVGLLLCGLASSGGRRRRLKIKFCQDWMDDNCPVMAWYHQQCVSSTRFRTIEHRRSTEGPFYHEFLLLRLTDGAFCRVERTSDGTENRPVRCNGSAAHDCIQWFAKEDEAMAAHASSLLNKLELSQEYDIMDVLAICYSVQNNEACRVYTLQRYNCYFMCLTVMNVFKRWGANRRASITRDISESLKKGTRIVDFQDEYEDLGIWAHAQRAAAHSLTRAAESVYQDVVVTMVQVAETMPEALVHRESLLWYIKQYTPMLMLCFSPLLLHMLGFNLVFLATRLLVIVCFIPLLPFLLLLVPLFFFLLIPLLCLFLLVPLLVLVPLMAAVA
ncbi:hypothetical protein FRC08_005022 [Ceratobasidium sp. 394]|nr:hypothetical protein FRC08_005022 [Ceratobasidium sp. 394]